MNIITRARAFVESLLAIGRRREADRRRCRVCQSGQVYKHGTYTRHPWKIMSQVVV